MALGLRISLEKTIKMTFTSRIGKLINYENCTGLEFWGSEGRLHPVFISLVFKVITALQEDIFMDLISRMQSSLIHLCSQ